MGQRQTVIAFASSRQASHASINCPPELHDYNPLMTQTQSTSWVTSSVLSFHMFAYHTALSQPFIIPSKQTSQIRAPQPNPVPLPAAPFTPRRAGKGIIIQQAVTEQARGNMCSESCWRARETAKTHLCLCARQQRQTVCTLQHRTNNIFQRRWFCFAFCGPSLLLS